MKSKRLFVFALALVLLIPVLAMAEKIPSRTADEVSDAFEPYTANEWIISPDDEPVSDTEVGNAPECDIKGIIACYDKEYLRVDLLLKNPISYDVKVWYAVKFEYTDMVEYYTYYPTSGEFIYEKEVDGEVVKTKSLKDDDKDSCGVTSSGSKKNTDVYLIINKEEHIAGDEGKKYYLTSVFYSGYVDKKDKLQIAEETKTVNLYFKR